MFVLRIPAHSRARLRGPVRTSAGEASVVHPRARGYTVNPAERYVNAGGTWMMPFPLNRGLPANQRAYYTWRDTAVLAKGAPFDSPGAELLSVIRTFGSFVTTSFLSPTLVGDGSGGA